MNIIEEAAAEQKLYDAATVGDVETFHQLLQQHPHFLHVVSFPYLRNVLHIAITEGNINIVEEVLKIKPQLARDVDSKKSSSLHIAAAQGSVGIVEKLLSVAPEMCWWLDDQGMNPIHVAAMKGHVMILEEMLEYDSLPAVERVHRGQTVLHLCVKHRQLRAFVVLAEKFGGLARAKDDDGETLLHMAVRSNQVEMVRYLVQRNKMADLTRNSMGITALDILNNENPVSDASTKSEIRNLLNTLKDKSEQEVLPKMSEMTMVVVVLIATMAFQAAVSPPGGVWQDDTSSHSAGKAVMASSHPKIYKHFVRASTTAFVSSLITIFLITTGATHSSTVFTMIAIYAMWVSMASIGVSYGASLIMTNPIMEMQSIGHIVAIVVSLFIGIFLLVVLYALQFLLKKGRRKQETLTTDGLITGVCRPNIQWEENRFIPTSFMVSLPRNTASPPSRDTADVP